VYEKFRHFVIQLKKKKEKKEDNIKHCKALQFETKSWKIRKIKKILLSA